MKSGLCACIIAIVLFAACNKKEPQSLSKTVSTKVPQCGSEFIADKPVKVGETGIELPVGTRICITDDNLEIRVELPDGFAFNSMTSTESWPPSIATYTCICSAQGNPCNVFYADGLGFGCLQSSCSGSCTGKFTYKGYSVERVVAVTDKETFFSLPEVQETLGKISFDEPYTRQSLYGVSFFLVKDEKLFLSKASCDCEGTKACILKVKELQLNKTVSSDYKIYYCEGLCNGCELKIS